MKRLPIIIIAFISLGILSCGNKTQTTDIGKSYQINDIININKEEVIEEIIEELPVNPYQQYNFPPIDSITLEDNLRLLQSFDDKNQVSIFKAITLELQRFIDENNIEVPENERKKLELWEALLHHLYRYDWWDAQTTAEMYYYRLGLGHKYLSLYIHNLLLRKATGTLAKKLKEEQILKDGLISAQREFLKTHIDEATYEGSSYGLKYRTVASLINIDHIESIRELYLSLTDSDTIIIDYQDISNQLFDKEYNHISNDLIPVKSEYYNYDDDIKPDYDQKKDRQTLRNEKRAWEKFIAKRQEISSMLSGNNKKAWDNATNRFKKSHLILLKNEFQGLGFLSNDKSKTLLLDDCTYEELFAYPNFSTKWKEYCDSLFPKK